MISSTKRKIKFDLTHIDRYAPEALYYLFCLIQSYSLDVKLETSPVDIEIRKFYQTQKSRLIDNGSIIDYRGPNIEDSGNDDIKYVLNLKRFSYEANKPLNLLVECVIGNEYHKDIGIKKGLSMEIIETNGTRFCPFIFAGTIEDKKFVETGIIMNILRGNMPVGYAQLGDMINFFILKHFNIKIEIE